MRNINTVQLESRNINTQPGVINDTCRKSEVIASIVNASLDVTASNLYIRI